MIDQGALTKKIRKIEIRTRRIVQNGFAGAYKSRYKGHGLEFESVRPYIPGDDVRAMDWKVTARTGTPHIKHYVEERQLDVMLVVDGSASLFFGSQFQRKRDVAAEVAATIAFSATANHDKVGLAIVTDAVEKLLPTKYGSRHNLSIIYSLLSFSPQGRKTELAVGLRLAHNVLSSGAIIFILSDFLTPPESYRSALRSLAVKHDVVAIVVTDPLEQTFPDVGLVGLQDLEDDNIHFVDTTSPTWRDAFITEQVRIREQRDQIIKESGAERIDIEPTSDYYHTLLNFFMSRRR